MTLDFLQSVPGADPVIVSAPFAATPERLFQAWTDPDQVLCWFGPKPNALQRVLIDLRVGGAYRFAFNEDPGAVSAVRGAYVEILPNRRLVFTWCWERCDDDGVLTASPTSSVTVTFAPQGAGTLLSIRHEALSAEDARHGVARGWCAAITHLRALSSEGDAQPESVTSGPPA